MPSLIDAVVVFAVEKYCDVESVAVDCVVFVAADGLDFAPDLAVVAHFELQWAFGFAGLIRLLHAERCAIAYVSASDLCDKNLQTNENGLTKLMNLSQLNKTVSPFPHSLHTCRFSPE